jgi:hypothetical protein
VHAQMNVMDSHYKIIFFKNKKEFKTNRELLSTIACIHKGKLLIVSSR